jgi:AcrR family transcriptional regulator
MPRGLARDHGEKRDALRGGAAQHFAQRGFDRASMASVAAACGVSKALIYHYYDSKESLLFDILNEHLSALSAAVDSAARTDAAPDHRLRAMVHAILREYEDADAEHKLQLDALDTLPDPMKAPLIAFQQQITLRMRDVLVQIAPDRITGRAMPATMTAFGILNWVYIWHRPDGPMTRTEFADFATDFILGGLGAV